MKFLIAELEKGTKDKSDYHKTIAKRDSAIIELLFSLGLRIEEASNIELEDIDLIYKTILIRGKGKKERLLYISSNIVIKKLMIGLKCVIS